MNRKLVFGAFSVILILGLVSMVSAQLTVGCKSRRLDSIPSYHHWDTA